MMLLAVFLLISFAELQLTVAQNVTDCTDISAGLGTTTIDPVIGETLELTSLPTRASHRTPPIESSN